MTIIEGSVTAPEGFEAAGIACGIKTQEGVKDLALICSEVPASAAATMTRNRVKGSPLKVTAEHLTDGRAQAIVANSGNSNACTGEQGVKDARRMAELTASCLRIRTEDVLVSSTGVIGHLLPMEAVDAGIRRIAPLLSPDRGDDAARAIMTTDLTPKGIAVEVELSDGVIRIGGICKGSGMIAPNMATMLSFLTTDAQVEPGLLRRCLRDAVERSFNMMTVDGDTSTSDTVILLANGASGCAPLTEGTEDLRRFEEALQFVTVDLAKKIAGDGEGATKFVTIRVSGARTFEDAKTVGKSVANSNLVKTALFGADPNWGRIVCAAGYSGAEVEPELLRVSLGDVRVFERGIGTAFDQEAARRILLESEITIAIDLGQGRETAEVYTCDLSYDYVKINAEYTT